MEIQQYFTDLGFPPALVIIIIAAMPILELRGAIPIAISVFEFSWLTALFLAILGNLLPIPFILLFLNWVTSILSRIAVFQKFIFWIFNHTKKRTGVIERYKRIGLTIFVAIPLPITGAWTGSIAAVLLGLPIWQSLIYIALGIITAGIIVTALSLMGWYGMLIIVLVFSAFLLFKSIRA